MNIYHVQAQLLAEWDGWESSRQADTMLVAAPDEGSAVRMVSDMAWNMSGSGYTRRRTFATVGLVVGWSDHRPFIEEPVRWARVDYLPGGTIATIVRNTYEEIEEG